MADLAKLVDELSALTVMEAADLAKMLEEKCSSFYDGISSVIVWSRKSSRIISSHLRYFFILRAYLS